MKRCWLEDPNERPDFTDIRQVMRRINKYAIIFEKTNKQTNTFVFLEMKVEIFLIIYSNVWNNMQIILKFVLYIDLINLIETLFFRDLLKNVQVII